LACAFSNARLRPRAFPWFEREQALVTAFEECISRRCNLGDQIDQAEGLRIAQTRTALRPRQAGTVFDDVDARFAPLGKVVRCAEVRMM